MDRLITDYPSLGKNSLVGENPQKLTVTAQNGMMQALHHMDPQLHRAAREGKMKLLEEIVKDQPELSGCLTPQKNTALHIAVRFGKEDVAKRLIELCASLISQPNLKGDTPLHLAARAGHQSLAELLTGGGVWRMRNSQGNRAIHEAVKRGHEKVAMHLLELERAHELMHDVNGAGESHLYLAAEAGLEKFVEAIVGMVPHAFILRGPDGQTPLHIAVIRGQLGIVNHLLKDLELTKQVDCFGKTALHHAASLCYDQEEKKIQILANLLTADSALAYVLDKDGNSPLLIAVRKGHIPAVKKLLELCPKSAEHVDGGGQNALHLAVTKNGEEMLGYLLGNHELKELINELDYDGNTPMHLATKNKYYKLVELLLQCKGVDLAVTNKDGLTALDAFGSNQLTDQQEKSKQKLMKHGAIHSRHYTTLQLLHSRDKAPDTIVLPISDLKSMVNTLAVLATLVAGITFAAAMTTPGGYKNEAPDEGLPALIRTAAMKAFMFTDAVAFCTTMMMSGVLVFAFYNNVSPAIVVDQCLVFAATAASATIIAFMTGVYALTSKESPWLAILVLLMGCCTFEVCNFMIFMR